MVYGIIGDILGFMEKKILVVFWKIFWSKLYLSWDLYVK